MPAAQGVTGWQSHNDDAKDHGEPTISYTHSLTTGHFYEATLENWESVDRLECHRPLLLRDTGRLPRIGGFPSRPVCEEPGTGNRALPEPDPEVLRWRTCWST
jgi:hypothetical protein